MEIRKRKWVFWQNICLLIEEGGLGIRDLHEVKESLLMKFTWKLIKEQSMWSNFFSTKYVGNSHIFSVMQIRKGSRFWKGLMERVPKILEHSRWIIQDGRTKFWLDNWLRGEAIDCISSCG